MSKESIETRLTESFRKTLNTELHECIGVKTPYVYGAEVREWAIPPHVTKGVHFRTNRAGVNRGLVSRCDECHDLFSQGAEAILEAYDPNDTRVPEKLPPKVFVPPPPPLDIPWGDGSEPVPARIQKED